MKWVWLAALLAGCASEPMHPRQLTGAVLMPACLIGCIITVRAEADTKP